MTASKIFGLILIGLVMFSGCTSKIVRHESPEVRPRAAVRLAPVSEKINKTAFHLYSNAVVFEAAGFFYQASENYRQALTYYPDSYQIRFSLAQSLHRLQHFDDALMALNPIDPEDLRVWMLRGSVYRARGQADSAHSCYRQAVAIDSNSSLGYTYLVAAYQVLGQVDSAVWAYEHLGRLQPSNPRIWYDLGELQWDLARLEEADRSFHRSVKAEPDSTNIAAIVRLGDLYTVRRHSDSAIIWYLRAIDLAPEDFRLWRKLGGSYGLLGQREMAKASYYRSLGLRDDAGNIMTRVWLGEMYLDGDSVEVGLEVARGGLAITPGNQMLHRLISSQYLHLEKFDSALAYAISEVTLAPADVDAVRRLAVLHFYNDSLTAADSILSSLVRLGDLNPINHRYLGRIALKAQDAQGAADEFTKLTELAATEADSWLDLAFAYRQLKLESEEIEAYRSGLEQVDGKGRLRLIFALAVGYERLGSFDSSVVTFEDLLLLDPDHHQALNYLGYSLADRGERLLYARDLIERAVEIEPENAAYLDSYGWVSYRLGEYETAQVYLRRAVVLDSDPTIFDHLGDTYQATGDTIAAQQWWNKALDLDPDNEAIKTKLDQ